MISENYSWVINTIDGKEINKFNLDLTVNKWQEINKDKIFRFSFVPTVPGIPRHEIFIDIDNGNRFIKYFGRGFLKQDDLFELKNYVFCVVTNYFRAYVNQSGEMIITPKDYEMRL